jgi:hypothetical protein
VPKPLSLDLVLVVRRRWINYSHSSGDKWFSHSFKVKRMVRRRSNVALFRLFRLVAHPLSSRHSRLHAVLSLQHQDH